MARIDECVDALMALYKQQGYLLYDNIIDNTDAFDLDGVATDEIAEKLYFKGVQILEEVPYQQTSEKNDEEAHDYSQSDYEQLYKSIEAHDPTLKPLVERVQTIKPAQFGEVRTLYRQMASGDGYSRQRLIETHMRVALKIANNEAQKYGYELSDAISAGLEGLVIGCNKFVADGFRTFQSYVAMWIIQNIHRECKPIFIESNCPAHALQAVMSAAVRYHEENNADLFYDCYYSYSEKKMSPYIQNIDETIKLFSIFKYGKVSLEYGMMIGHNSLGKELTEKILSISYESDSELQIELQSRKELCQKLLDTLDIRTRAVILRRFGFYNGDEQTLETIGSQLGITRERVRQIENKGLQQLRSSVDKFNRVTDTIEGNSNPVLIAHGRKKRKRKIPQPVNVTYLASQEETRIEYSDNQIETKSYKQDTSNSDENILPVSSEGNVGTAEFNLSLLAEGVKVVHKFFSKGTITHFDEKHVWVRFQHSTRREMSFVIPVAFEEGYLKIISNTGNPISSNLQIQQQKIGDEKDVINNYENEQRNADDIKHAYWIHDKRNDESYMNGMVILPSCICSQCGYHSNMEKPVCPQCRSLMDKNIQRKKI